jgi:hypothetical protein
MDLIRDTAFGRLIRFVSRKQLLAYPEELQTFPREIAGNEGFRSAPGPRCTTDQHPDPNSDASSLDQGEKAQDADLVDWSGPDDTGTSHELIGFVPC